MKPIVDRLDSLGIFADSPHKQPNHCLINTYKPGQGIMPHEDGEAYHPTVATVSLGASVVLDIWNKDDQSKPRWRVVQEPRSLLITKDRMYYDFLHGIAAVETDEDISPETVANWDMLGDLRGVRDGRLERRTRMSLTYRDVKKVANLGNKFQFAGPRSLRS